VKWLLDKFDCLTGLNSRKNPLHTSNLPYFLTNHLENGVVAASMLGLTWNQTGCWLKVWDSPLIISREAKPSMSTDENLENERTAEEIFAPVPVDLKVPEMALLLAWLIPGAGHLYQGRTGKGLLFMTCILSIYFWGLSMGGGHVVYAKWNAKEKRLPYICQVAVGLPALPAIVQSMRDKGEDSEPFEIFGNKIMAPPANEDELKKWHNEYGFLFDMGTLYTMIAGLLNVLVMFDAFSGPVFILPEKEKKKAAKAAAEESASDKTPGNDKT
jgi:TM2 domain-containing membrane protein YozV